MALIKCSECGNEVSDKAAACPKCGNPINEKKNEQVVVKKKPKQYGCLHLILFLGLAVFIYSLWTGTLTTSETKDMCEDYVSAFTTIQLDVANKLASPSTAEFEYARPKKIAPCTFLVSSHVDSKNALGAIVRSYFTGTVSFNKDSNQWEITGLRVN